MQRDCVTHSLWLSPGSGVVDWNRQNAAAGCGCAPPGDESVAERHTVNGAARNEYFILHSGRGTLTVGFWLEECEDLTSAPGPVSAEGDTNSGKIKGPVRNIYWAPSAGSEIENKYGCPAQSPTAITAVFSFTNKKHLHSSHH